MGRFAIRIPTNSAIEKKIPLRKQLVTRENRSNSMTYTPVTKTMRLARFSVKPICTCVYTRCIRERLLRGAC